jgi:transcriptional regulator with GAF, ATPase, and Fis domain
MESSEKTRLQLSTTEHHDMLLSLRKCEKEKDTLLTLSEDVAAIRTRHDLVSLINGKLKELLPFNHGGVGIVNKNKGTYTALLFDTATKIGNKPELDTYFKEGYPAKNKIIDVVLGTDQPVVFDLDELIAAGEVPVYTRLNYEAGMKEMVLSALRSKEESLGFFGVFSSKKNGFSKNHLNILRVFCSQLSIAVANIVANEEILERENEKSMLLSLSKDITLCRTYEDVQNILTNKLGKYFHFSEITIYLTNPDQVTHNCYAHAVLQETINHPDFIRSLSMKFFNNDGVFNAFENSREPVIFDMEELVARKNKPWYIDFWYEHHKKELIGFPIHMNDEPIGAAYVYVEEKNAFTTAELNLAQAICSYIGIALSNIRHYEKIQSHLEEISKYRSQLENENKYLRDQIKTAYNWDEIIGSDGGLRNAFQMALNVAPSDSTVLILGETGTGKELIARVIHNSSFRKQRPMVKLNCAALPSHLVESELFGHEKGSFTGATERRIGKFELANNGTLFLDEIGEMSLNLQAKLLRAIQEKEIERIGGSSVIKTNVRIIAASNRDLKKEVEGGRFRSDLYYRLNVFPISLPPLRERKEDIPMLVSYFLNRFSQKSGKKIVHISPKAVSELIVYHWPGNVRELENVIERSVLMAQGNTIAEIQLLRSANVLSDLQTGQDLKSLEENEREYILSILKKCDGKIRGEDGAAKILKVPATTLHSKMKKLGIRKNVH